MERIHVFEFEDFRWFPAFLRNPMTHYINTMHRLVKSKDDLKVLLLKAMSKTKSNDILDLCSGSGGPMIPVFKELRQEIPGIRMVLSDLYPNMEFARKVNATDDNVFYDTRPLNAADPGVEHQGLRTMICSMHHMKPDTVKHILQTAMKQRKPILIYEMSDNSLPLLLAWIALPLNILSVLFITLLIRPFTWQQFVFTYLIPVLPLTIAWDGAISNMRTYTRKDWEKILGELRTDNYQWESEVLGGRMNKMYLMGYPVDPDGKKEK